MSIINFSIPKILEKRVEQTIKKRGFSSKAEFFRVAAMRLIDRVDEEDIRLQVLTTEISKEIAQRYQSKNTPSVKSQLADV